MSKLLNITIAMYFLIHGYTSFATNYYVKYEYIIPHDTLSVCDGFACEYDIAHFWVEENYGGPLDFNYSGIRRFDTLYNWEVSGMIYGNGRDTVNNKIILNQNNLYINLGESRANCIDGGIFGIVALIKLDNNNQASYIRNDNGTSGATAYAVFVCTPNSKFTFNSANTICQNTCVAFTDSSLYRPRQWQWQIANNQNGILFEDTLQHIQYCFADTGTYFIKQKVWNEKGIDSSLQSLRVISSPSITGDTLQTIPLSNTTQTELEACAEGELYEWFPKENLSCTNCNFTTATINKDEKYYCVVSNTNGCSETCYYHITLPFDIFIPTAFSPNGDGVNDVFRVRGNNIEVQNCKIYNRFGNEIYNGNLENGWNGTYKNEALAIDVYVYTIIYKNLKTNSIERKSGNISLIK